MTCPVDPTGRRSWHPQQPTWVWGSGWRFAPSPRRTLAVGLAAMIAPSRGARVLRRGCRGNRCVAVVPLALMAYDRQLHKAGWLQPSAQERIVIWGVTSAKGCRSALARARTSLRSRIFAKREREPSLRTGFAIFGFSGFACPQCLLASLVRHRIGRDGADGQLPFLRPTTNLRKWPWSEALLLSASSC